ncbi:Bax inhibitor-1/YccA family protein [Flavobacterium sp. N1719]|uniref:Bax inhibitor-1/YccA family protein n=1 Tax=Flavobacterium sp. N1719 TaxID=2885633 RepID=UPI002221C581|nr:Bax inhibitor-1/YccA family protein [Flavobacterium sp. N1719]
MESKNPFFNTKSYNNAETVHDAVLIDYNQTMSLSGTINKAFIMLILLVAGAVTTWTMTGSGFNPVILIIGGAIVGMIAVLVSTFKPELSPYLAPGYAIFEGLFIGGLSAFFEAKYPGIVIQAVGATFVTFFVCLGLYKFQIVKVTEKFRSVVVAATLAIAAYYLITWLITLFTNFQPVHYGNSLMSIGISIFVIVIAALNIFLDFDQIERGVANRAPKYMEWYGAMGLMITLVWLYVEFLRLLSKINSRD